MASLRQRRQRRFAARTSLDFLRQRRYSEKAKRRRSREVRRTVRTPKTVVILFDTSLSMQWEKLERSYQALETLLRTLKPADKFNLILFNSETQRFQPR